MVGLNGVKEAGTFVSTTIEVAFAIVDVGTIELSVGASVCGALVKVANVVGMKVDICALVFA